MGLDMYLNKIERVEGYTFEDLMKLENALLEDITILPDDVKPLAKEMDFVVDGETWYKLNEQVGYWRKANQIHNWFIENIQNGIDDCEQYEVTKEDLVKLLENVQLVLKEKDKVVSERALPTSPGFFFGNTDYDEYYYTVVENTKVLLENVMQKIDFKNNHVYYDSSW